MGSQGPNGSNNYFVKNYGPRPTNQGERSSTTPSDLGQSSFSSNSGHGSNLTCVRGDKEIPNFEFIRRREEGKCYYCGLPYTKGHNCQAKHLRLTILAEAEGGGAEHSDPEGENLVQVLDGEPVDEGAIQWLELSAASAHGLTPPRTIKLSGALQREKLAILIDSGANHNFICRKLVARLGLDISPTAPFAIKLVDGFTKLSSGCCWNLSLNLGAFQMQGEFFIFDLGGVEAILGMTWLRTLGDMEVNWEKQRMAFVQGKQFVELQGEPSLTNKQLSPKSLAKVTNVESATLVWAFGKRESTPAAELHHLTVEGKETEQLNPVLSCYSVVFENIKELPPPRQVDHIIPLKDGTSPINVRPYRYPHHQKNEMERLVAEMLEAGVI